VSHLAVVPVVLPLVVAAILVLLASASPSARRVLSLAATATCLAVALALAASAAEGEVTVYRVGGWPAPFGILLVVDRLSAAMLVLTDFVALAALAHAVQGSDESGRHFHALFAFQLVGIHGAFLTGDLFNLFVFFEILLIASYCLLLHGGGAERVRAAVHYVVLNLVGSALFLVGVGAIYGVTGGLSMAHVARRIAELDAGDAGIVRAAGLVLMVVFGLKAAAVPLHFWLPRAYPAATPAVAAFFAIMTKVGIYCLVRTASLLFGPGAGIGSDITTPWLLPVALLTQVVGVIGAVASRDLRTLSSYLLVSSVGVMLTGIALASPASLTAALFYLVHSTLSIAAMFLLVGVVAASRGDAQDRIERARAFAGSRPLGLAFLVGSAGMVGLPPLAGFLGKVALLDAATPAGRAQAIAVWAVVLGSSLISIFACARAGATVFWAETRESNPSLGVVLPRLPTRTAVPAIGLLVLTSAFAALGGRAFDFAGATAEQVLEPATYVRSVFPGGGGP
jgi:multicomponent K+:H+ antiporter subunit D